jgi:hypothetical protein
MRKPIHLTAPPPTLEEIERLFPISKARKKALLDLVEEFKAHYLRTKDASANSINPEKRRKRASAA